MEAGDDGSIPVRELIDETHIEDEPHISESHNDKPHINKPHIDEPLVDELHTKERLIDGPPIDESHVDELHIDEPAIEEPHDEELLLDEPQINEPLIDEPHIDEPHIDEPVIDEPHIDKPHDDVLLFDKALTNEPHIDKLDIEKPHNDEPHNDEPHIDEPHIDKPQIVEPHIEGPVDDVRGDCHHGGSPNGNAGEGGLRNGEAGGGCDMPDHDVPDRGVPDCEMGEDDISHCYIPDCKTEAADCGDSEVQGYDWPKTAELGPYIQRACQQSRNHNRKQYSPPAFADNSGARAPRLKHGRTNRILLYRGGFNPPHLGHVAVLKRAFYGCRDLNVIAAIVIPYGDESLEYKCRNGLGPVLTRFQRALLWTGGRPHEWLWAFGYESLDWEDFRYELYNSIRCDGFNLRFVTLIGPDHVHRHREMSWGRCDEMVVCNAARHADFVFASGPAPQLRQLFGCEDWKPVVWDEAEALKAAEWDFEHGRLGILPLAPQHRDHTGQQKKSPEADKRTHDEFRAKLRRDMDGVAVCARRSNRRQTLRFVPAWPSAVSTMTGEIKSTEIRRILRTCQKANLLCELTPLVQYPKMLLRICEKWEDELFLLARVQAEVLPSSTSGDGPSVVRWDERKIQSRTHL